MLAPTDLPLWKVDSAWDGKPVALVGASMGDTGHGAPSTPCGTFVSLCLDASPPETRRADVRRTP